MARVARLVAANQPHYIIQRGHDGLVVFRDEQDFRSFLHWLRDASRQFRVAIHAYVLMPDHMHLLATPSDETGLARMMQWVGRQYVPYFNARYGRKGTLWQSRYRAVIIEAESYLLACCRYIELNPVRAQLASSAADYPWSSHPHHAGLKPDPLITDHPIFWHLGNTPFDREAAYRAILEREPAEVENTVLLEAVRKGWPLGSEAFRVGLARQLGRRVEPAPRGRPKREGAVGG